MASSSAFTTDYQPTPLEQAYTFYLLDVVLQVPREPFRLSGRLAVPFLNSSGVDRNVLRQMWTVVDPAMEGSLLEVIQFSSLLKMVSLAQQRCLDLAEYEGQLLYRQVPLPTFLNLVVPTHNLLLELYPAVTANQMLLTAPLQKLSVSDAFGDLIVDAPLPALPSAADEDFGDLQEAQGAQEAHGSVEDVDEFGDFVGDSTIAVGQNSESQPIVSHSVLPQGTSVDDEDFGDFSGIPAIGALHDTPDVIQYDSISLAPTDPAVGMGFSQPVHDGPLPSLDAPGVMDDFGDFVGTSVETPFTEMHASSWNHTPAAFHESSQFQTLSAPGSNQLDGMTSTDAFSSAFDKLQPIHDQPLPPLVESQPDDSFGEFHVGVTEVTADVLGDRPLLTAFGGSIQSLPHKSQDLATPDDGDNDDTFGGFEGADNVLNAGADPLSSAFDDIQPLEDQPLPALHLMANPTTRQEDDSDDFGHFEGVTNVMMEHDKIETDNPVDSSEVKHERSLSPMIHQIATDDDFGDFEDIPDNRQGDAPALDDPFSSAFDSIQPIQNQPLPPLNFGSPPFGDLDDDFGSFEGVSGGMDNMTIIVDSISGSGAVGGLQPFQDQPSSPSLDNASPQTEIEHENKEFELFGEGTTVENITTPTIDNPLSAFDDIHPTQDQPLKSLQSWSAPAQGDDTKEATFGTLSRIVIATNATITAAQDQILESYRHIQPIQDQPLPSLNLGGTVTPEDDDDDFGDFMGTSDIAPSDSFPTTFGFAQPNSVQTPSFLDQNQSELDDFGEFTGIPAPQTNVPVEPVFQFSIPPDLEDPMTSSLSVGESLSLSEGKVQGSHFETAPFENRHVVDNNLGSTRTSTLGVGDFETSNDCIRPTGNNIQNSLIGESVAGQIESVNQDDASEFSDFEGVKGSPVDSDAVGIEDVAHIMVPIQDTTQTTVDMDMLQKDMPANQPESAVDDEDWGDFEHVQVPTNTEVPPVAAFTDFANAPSPEENLYGLATSTVPIEFAAFNSVFEPSVDIQFSQTADKNLVFSADFGDVESYKNAQDSKATDDEFGDWDSFQDATPSAITCRERPQTLDEIQVWLQGRSLTGLLANIDVSLLVHQNLVSKNWTAGFGTKSTSTLQRARRCCELVSLLSTSCSNLLSSAWTRVVTVVRNELTMGLFLLQEAKGLSKESKKEVKAPLGNMVSGLGEFVRVVRSIIATVGDIFCLDLQAPLSREFFASSWQGLDIVQVALEVEESWKSIEKLSRALGLSIAARLETIQAIRTIAADAEWSSLCQLTLQPLSHVENTKNEVIWEGKPFMACAANFWSNRVSNTFSLREA